MEILFEERKKKKTSLWDCELVSMGTIWQWKIFNALFGVIKWQWFGPVELRKEMKEKGIWAKWQQAGPEKKMQW